MDNQQDIYSINSLDFLKKNFERLSKNWGWFVIIGLLITICGFFAAIYLVGSSVASVAILTSFLFIGGIAQIIIAFQMYEIKKLFWGTLLSGTLFLISSYLMLVNPVGALITITFLIALFLFLSGITRIITSIQLNTLPNRGWFIFSGIIGIIAAILIAMDLKVMSLFIPGLLLSFDLLFSGISLFLFGLQLKSLASY